MRRLTVALVVLLCGCPDEATPPPTTTAPLEELPLLPVAQVTKVEGTVQVERDGGTSKVTGGPVFEDDVVVTAVESAATLRDEHGRELELGEETRFRVGAKLAVIELLEGTLTVGAGDGGLGLKTRFGSAEVESGASGRVRVKDGKLEVEVLEGGFLLFDADAGQVDAKPGQRIELSGGGIQFFETQTTPPPVVPKAASAPTLVVELGTPVVKRPGEARFSPVKSSTELAPGTTFQVPAGSGARVVVPNGTVRLQGGASGISQGLTDVGGVAHFAIEKSLGSLTLMSDGRGKAGLEVGGASIESSAESTIVVTAVGKKSRVDVRAGEAIVTVKGVATTVRAGDSVVVDQSRAVAAPNAKPGLTIGGGRVRVHGDVKDVSVALPNDSNRVQLSREPDFTKPYVQGVVGKTVTIPNGKGPVFYRVLDEKGAPAQQGRVDFLSDVASARDTTTRTDTVAETGQKATVFYQSKVPALTFAFAAQADTKAWQFQLFRASELSRPIVDKKVNEARLVLEPGILAEGDFVWSATPLETNGAPKAGGRMNKLSVVYDNARTTLLIERPLLLERATASTQAVGVAPRASTLFINGKPVRVDDAGRFSVTVGAVDSVVFRVVSQDGDNYWVRRLKR